MLWGILPLLGGNSGNFFLATLQICMQINTNRKSNRASEKIKEQQEKGQRLPHNEQQLG